MALDLSPITSTLYVAASPAPGDVATLHALSVRLLISVRMRPPRPSVRHAVEHWMHLPCIDSPLTPIPMLLLWRGVDAALPILEEGGVVMVHCHYGIHRSVALACCILIGQGYTPDAAMALVKERRPQADPYAWYIGARIKRFQYTWV